MAAVSARYAGVVMSRGLGRARGTGVTSVDSRGKRRGGQVDSRIGRDAAAQACVAAAWAAQNLTAARLRVRTHAYARHGPPSGSDEGRKRSPRMVEVSKVLTPPGELMMGLLVLHSRLDGQGGMLGATPRPRVQCCAVQRLFHTPSCEARPWPHGAMDCYAPRSAEGLGRQLIRLPACLSDATAA